MRSSPPYAALTGDRYGQRAMRVAAAILGATVLAALAALPAGGSSTYQTPATSRLTTAVYLSSPIAPADENMFFNRVRNAGARAVRMTLAWNTIAPKKRPPGFDPTNPADPAYNWTYVDRLITGARAHGLEPLMTISSAPTWAGGTHASPGKLGQFARAAARRYSGSFQGLPRVRYWLVWNEPNLSRYLAPQYQQRRMVGASRYRKMVNAVAASVHGVHQDNVVVAGETAPLDTPSSPGAMKFARGVLCVSQRLRSTCKTVVHVDIWSTHPYTSGGPTHKSFGSDGVALGNLTQLQRLVRAAVRLHHVSSSRHVRVWATEFSWNTKPPCRLGLPMPLAKRWVSEALYRIWSWHIGTLTWFQLVDYGRGNPIVSGLYYRGKTFSRARPKPILNAFRFPFVAFEHGSRVYVWGRTPDGLRHTISLQRSAGHGWAGISTLVSNSSGIFFRTLTLSRANTSWSLRAQVRGTGSHSVGFSLRSVSDRFYRPFGC